MASNWGTETFPKISFLATLNLPYLSKITNNMIFYLPHWPPIPTKLLSHIPKFKGKDGQDPLNHIMAFHLWCLSNSLSDDNIILRIFQWTLTKIATKWYIELPTTSFQILGPLQPLFWTTSNSKSIMRLARSC